MTFADFQTTTNGVAVTFDNIKANYGQCAQLASRYCVDVLGWMPPMIPYAVDWWINATVLANFTQVPVGQEQTGDLGIFGASATINSPEAGHMDIVLVPHTGNGFSGWDSNWGGVPDKNVGTPGYGYPAAHQVNHTYNDILGFLRYKENDMIIQTTDDANAIYILAFNRPATPQEAQNATGKSLVQVVSELTATAPYKAQVAKYTYYDADVAAAKAEGGTTLIPGKYVVE